jgi:hypothetical protein
MDTSKRSYLEDKGFPEPVVVSGYGRSPIYRDLSHRVSSALAMTEAAFVEARREARRRSKRAEYEREKK